MKRTKFINSMMLLVAFLFLTSTFVGCSTSNTTATQQVATQTATTQQVTTQATTAVTTVGNTTPAANASDEKALDGEIYIGITTGITGPEPDSGAHMVNAVTIACEDINAKGGVLGKKLVPIFEDDKFSAEGGLLATQRLIARNDITAIVGYQKTVSLMASIDLLNVPTLAGMSSATLYEADNPYVFRVYGAEPVIGYAGANWMIDTYNPSKIFIITSTDDVGSGAGDVYESVCKDRNIPFIHETLNPGDRDFTGQIMKAKAEKCDVVLLYVQSPEGVVLFRQFHELDFVVPSMGGASTGTTSFLSQCDPAYSEGVHTFSGFDMSNPEPDLADFIERYTKRFNIDIHSGPVNWYPVILMLADAIERAGSTDKDAIVEALWQTKDFPAYTRILTTDYRRDMVHETYIYRITNAKTVKIDSAEVEVQFRNGTN